MLSQFFQHDDLRTGWINGTEGWKPLMSYKTGVTNPETEMENFMDLADPNDDGRIGLFHYIAQRLDTVYAP